jgi:hypothetical protein
MATNARVAQPPASSHPLATYLSAMQAARDELVGERLRQEALGSDNTLTVSERADALAEVARLASEIGHLDDSREAFLVGLVTATVPPSQALVDATVKLAKDLAAVVVSANRPAVLIRIVSGFINGAAAVATGTVPPAP